MSDQPASIQFKNSTNVRKQYTHADMPEIPIGEVWERQVDDFDILDNGPMTSGTLGTLGGVTEPIAPKPTQDAKSDGVKMTTTDHTGLFGIDRHGETIEYTQDDCELMTRKERKQLAKRNGKGFVPIVCYKGSSDMGWK